MNVVNAGYDSTNYYVVEQSGRRLLIDTGWPGTLPKLLARLKRNRIALADVGYLIVTHYHPDHAGLVQELKQRGLKHVVLEPQLAAVAQLKAYMKPDSGYVEIRVEDSLQLTVDGSRAWLKSLGLSGEVVSTPGHSDDSISLVLDEGAAFTGDLTPLSIVTDDQVEAVQRSWDRLRRLHVRQLYPGHGPIRPF